MKGIYICYNESKNGPFDEAVTISKQSYLIWKHSSPCKSIYKFPTKILIQLSGKDVYYEGELLLVRNFSDLNPKIFLEPKHRPKKWRNTIEDAKAGFFISNLREVEPSLDIKETHPPQGIKYVDF